MEKKKILEIYRDADGNVKAEGTDSETMVMTIAKYILSKTRQEKDFAPLALLNNITACVLGSDASGQLETAYLAQLKKATPFYGLRAIIEEVWLDDEGKASTETEG